MPVCVAVCEFVFTVYFKWFILCLLSELLRVFRADDRTEPVHTLQQVAVLPVHRCAPASEDNYHLPVHRCAPAAEAQSHPVSGPAPERVQLAASHRTRQAVQSTRFRTVSVTPFLFHFFCHYVSVTFQADMLVVISGTALVRLSMAASHFMGRIL